MSFTRKPCTAAEWEVDAQQTPRSSPGMQTVDALSLAINHWRQLLSLQLFLHLTFSQHFLHGSSTLTPWKVRQDGYLAYFITPTLSVNLFASCPCPFARARCSFLPIDTVRHSRLLTFNPVCCGYHFNQLAASAALSPMALPHWQRETGLRRNFEFYPSNWDGGWGLSPFLKENNERSHYLLTKTALFNKCASVHSIALVSFTLRLVVVKL